MNLREALKRIENLERKVHELEARSPVVIHNYPAAPAHPVPPLYAPVPVYPGTGDPRWFPPVAC